MRVSEPHSTQDLFGRNGVCEDALPKYTLDRSVFALFIASEVIPAISILAKTGKIFRGATPYLPLDAKAAQNVPTFRRTLCVGAESSLILPHFFTLKTNREAVDTKEPVVLY